MTALRIVSWNIRAGGGHRVAALAAQLMRWRPDVVALSEFRGTPPSIALARTLANRGLAHQLSTASAHAPRTNRLLLASRWPMARISLRGEPASELGRFLLARIAAPDPITLGAMHVPNRVTGRKFPFLDQVLAIAHTWRRGPAVLAGDTNSGLIDLDEEVPAFIVEEDGWIRGLEAAGWSDAFRHCRGEERSYTWYSPNGGNGFRIDQAFVNRALRPRLSAAWHEWGRVMTRGRRRPAQVRRDAVSDHAALLIDLAPADTAPEHAATRSSSSRHASGSRRTRSGALAARRHGALE